MLERSDELRDDPRLLAWAAMGSIWLREGETGRARGYYYRVYVYVDPTQPGYSPHYDPAIVDSGNGVGGSACSA